MDPWYKIATPQMDVREGRSFNPDEFAIPLELTSDAISSLLLFLSNLVESYQDR